MKPPYQLLPDLAPDDLRRLTESIVANGVEMPVVVDENGDILDGHHRQMIADSLGIECPRIVKHGLSNSQKRIYAAEMNIARRHMTDAQKVKLGMEIEPDIAAEANRRQGTRSDLFPSPQNIGDGRPTQTPDLVEDFPQGQGPKTRDVVAGKLGIGSGKTYDAYKKVLAQLAEEPDGEQLMKHVEDGDWDIKDARAELKRRHPPVRKATPVAVDPSAEQEPTARPPKFPTPIITPPAGMIAFDAAMAIKNLRGIDTTDYGEAGAYLIELDRDAEGLIESLPDILKAIKRIASRANRQLNKMRLVA